MIKKTIKFENYNGEEETEDFYFNLSKGELVKMQMAAIDQHTESFQDKLEKIGKHLNGKALIEVVDEIIDSSYGVRSTDGKNFDKVQNGVKLVENFKSTGAYSELIVELCTDAKATADFMNGLVPASLRNEVNKEVATAQTARERSEAQMQGYKKKEAPSVQKVDEVPTVITGETVELVSEPTPVSVSQLSREELEKLVASQNYGQSTLK